MSFSLFIHLAIHLGLVFAVALYLFIKYRNYRLIIISFLTGILIDIDHLVDYFYWKGNFFFSFKEFFAPASHALSTQKVIVFLHGWEYLLILFWLGKKYFRKVPGALMALTLPYLFHLVLDQVTSAGNIFSYSLIYRILNGFSLIAFNQSLR